MEHPELETLFAAIGDLCADHHSDELHYDAIFDSLHTLTGLDMDVIVQANINATQANQRHRQHKTCKDFAAKL